MRIAQVAPLYESVPPKRYGGTERVVSYLTEELVKQGQRFGAPRMARKYLAAYAAVLAEDEPRRLRAVR